MANTILIRRGLVSAIPASAPGTTGELRYATDTKELYIDTGAANQKIGGDPSGFPVSTAQQTALNGKASLVTIQSLATDAAATITPTASVYQVFHTGTLTADRLMTLTTAGMTSGFTIRFTRTGAGAFNLSVGGLKNLATNTWCDVVFNGSAWVLTAYGTL